jgi:hypothetical protein
MVHIYKYVKINNVFDTSIEYEEQRLTEGEIAGEMGFRVRK